MAKVFDRVGMTTSTTGTGTITLGSAITDSTNGDLRSFAGAGAVNGDVVNYLLVDGNAWEIGTGAYTASGTTLSRTLASSSTGSLLNLSGSAKVYSVLTAGSLGAKAADRQVFTTSGTWTKPSGFGANAVAYIEVWGGGQGGGRSTSLSSPPIVGGSGGGYAELWIPLSSLGATETVVVGAGGAGATTSANGSSGGDSKFGNWIGAKGGFTGSGGGALYPDGSGYGGTPAWNGGTGGNTADPAAGGYSFYAGGGGGAGNAGGASGGKSVKGGVGGSAGNPGNAGQVPGGGGGGGNAININGGAGARGEVRITVFDGV